jgi:lysophospholipase L1-like esterase
MNLVLVGDSIRLGYQPLVEELLAGRMSVVATAENCRSSRDIAAHFDTWIVDLLEPGSVVHLNAGLHDLRRVDGADGEPHVPLDEYRSNVDAIVRRAWAEPRVARLIVATSTPVDDAQHAAARLSNRFGHDVIAYNNALREVARDLATPLNDLYLVIQRSRDRFLADDGVHLTPAGNQAAAAAVVAAVTAAQ